MQRLKWLAGSICLVLMLFSAASCGSKIGSSNNNSGSASTTTSGDSTGTSSGVSSGGGSDTGTTPLVSCADTVAGANEAVICGTLTVDAHSDASEVAGATVYVVGQENNKTTTDANGNYVLVVDTSASSTVLRQPVDTKRLNVGRKAKATKKAAKTRAASNQFELVVQSGSQQHGIIITVTVNEGGTVTIEPIAMAQTGAISGVAKLEGQTNHTGIMVYIPGTSFNALTDSDGNFTVGNVPPGIYPYLRAEKTGYGYALFSDVFVEANATTDAGEMLLLKDSGVNGGVSINDGGPYATSRTVTLYLSATDNATLMKVSEDVNFVNANWLPLQSTTTYTFDSDGAKTLYVKFAAIGLESSPYSASVLVDTTAPTVTATDPADGASVLKSQAFAITFSEGMDEATLISSNITLDNGASCNVTYDAATNTATCTPTAPLTAGTAYTLSLSSGIKDAHGNALAPYSFGVQVVTAMVSTIGQIPVTNNLAADADYVYSTLLESNLLTKTSIATGTSTNISGIIGGYYINQTPLYQPSGIIIEGENLYVFQSPAIDVIDKTTGKWQTYLTDSDMGFDPLYNNGSLDPFFMWPNQTDMVKVGNYIYIISTDNALHKLDLSLANYPFSIPRPSNGGMTIIAGHVGAFSPGYADGFGAAARFAGPMGITTDGVNLYVADSGNSVIRKIVIATGEVTTFAGSAGMPGSTDGIGGAARFGWPMGIVRVNGDLYVADSSNFTIRKIVIASGEVTTIAGAAGMPGNIDGAGTDARFNYPMAMTSYSSTLYVSDGNVLRKIEF